MLTNAAYLGWGWRRLLHGRGATLSEVAIESWEVSPAQETDGRPAVFPDGALDRIRGLSPWRDWQVEKALIDGATAHHHPTRAFVLTDAVIAGPYVYCGAWKERIGAEAPSHGSPALPTRQEIEDAHLATTWTGADFFGNFLLDSFPLEMIPGDAETRIGAPGKPYRHEGGYRDLLGLPQPWMPGHARIRHLTVYSDFAQNPFKESRYRQLRDRLSRRLGGQVSRPGVFLARGDDGVPRRLVNEAALCETLAARGFEIVVPSRAEPEEISRKIMGARIVIAVEGSHLSHAIYSMADNGAFLVIQPPDRFAMPYKEFADRMGMRFGFVVAEPADGGFAADTDEILAMVDRLS